jgi:hypothetical protein
MHLAKRDALMTGCLTEIRCQEKPRMQDFSPFTPELLGALSLDPQTPGRNKKESKRFI